MEEEFEVYKQAIKINPDDAKAHYDLGLAYGESIKWKKAIKSYKQAVRINPDFAEAHYFLGGAYVFSEDRGGALEQYKILKKLDTELANELFSLIAEGNRVALD